MLFFDVKNNIIKDEKEFKKEQSRNLKAQISLVSLEDQSFQILLTFGDNQEFWRKIILITDIKEGTKINILIRNDALYWNSSPETNPFIIFREDDDFVYFIETCSDYFDVNFCPRIQLYRTKSDNQFLIKTNLLTLYNDPINPIITTKTFHEIIHEHDKDYLPEVRSYRKKLRENTEPRTSLSYMEVQLDILYQLVFLLLQENKILYNKALELIPNLDDFKNILERTYITTIKSLPDCLNEVIENKSKIRNIQKEYYAYKNHDKSNT